MLLSYLGVAFYEESKSGIDIPNLLCPIWKSDESSSFNAGLVGLAPHSRFFSTLSENLSRFDL